MGILDDALDRLVDKRGGDLRLAQSLEIAAAFGAVLDAAAPLAGETRDAAGLPFSKIAVKHALVVLLRAAGEGPSRESLRIAFLRLADWQSRDEPARVPIHFGHVSTRANPLALAMRLAADRDPESRLLAAAKAERVALAEELRRLKL